MIEYIFHEQDETILKSFFDNLNFFNIDQYALWGLTLPMKDDYIYRGQHLDWQILIHCSLVGPENIMELDASEFQKYLTHKIYGAVYLVPNGFVVGVEWDDEIDDELAHKVLDRVIEKANVLGFNAEVISEENQVLTIPWKKIEVTGWDQIAVNLWNKNKTAEEIKTEIGIRLGMKVSVGRIRNRITELRNELRKLGLDHLIIYHRDKKNKK